MPFTPISVQAHRFNPDGSPANGSISFTPNATMKNGIDVVEPTPVVGNIGPAEIAGLPEFELTVFACDDEGTTPTSPLMAYHVSESIAGIRTPVTYDVYITLEDSGIVDPAVSFTDGSPVVVLGTYLAVAAMVGQTFSSSPCAGTILAFDAETNSLIISSNSVATEVAGAEISGGAVDLSTLTTYSPAPSVGTYIPYNLGQTDGQVPTWNASEGQWVPETPSGGSSTLEDAQYQLQVACNIDSVLAPASMDLLTVYKATVWDNNGIAYDAVRIQSVPLLVPAAGRVVNGIHEAEGDFFAHIGSFDATNWGGYINVTITVTDLTGTNKIVVTAAGNNSSSGPGASFTLDWTTAVVIGTPIGSDLSLNGNFDIVSADGGLYIVAVDYEFGYDD